MKKGLLCLALLAGSVAGISSASASDIMECQIVDAQGAVKGMNQAYWNKGAIFRIVSEQDPKDYKYTVTEVAFARYHFDQDTVGFYTAPTRKLPYYFSTPNENAEVVAVSPGKVGKTVYQFEIKFTDKETKQLNATLTARCEYWMQ